MEFPKKGDIIIADAEPHAGHEMGGHNPKKGNIRRHYVVGTVPCQVYTLNNKN